MKNSDDPIIRRLEEVVRELPELKEAGRLYGAMLPLLRGSNPAISHLQLTPEEVNSKMARGEPLLTGLDLEVDQLEITALLLKLAQAVENDGSDSVARESGKIRRALERGDIIIATLLQDAANGGWEEGRRLALDSGLDQQLLMVLVQNALKPVFQAWRREIEPLANGAPWDKGYCFVCGAPALMGELQENEQALHLRCGHCGADWPSARLRCRQCGNEDHETQRFFYPEDKHNLLRVEACDLCKSYLKVVAAYSPTPAEMLVIEDLATIHLDCIAQEHGYERPASRGEMAP